MSQVDDREALLNVGFDAPFRFTDTCDLVTSRDEKSIEDNMRNSVMIQSRSLPLMSRLGSRISIMPFDPNDQALIDLISAEVFDAILIGETRVVPDDKVQVVTDSSGNAVAVVVNYIYRNTLKGWRSFRLAEPEFKMYDKGNV